MKTDALLHDGITLRDYFAGLAMQSYLHAPVRIEDCTDQHVAKIAYEMADAMLVRRKQTLMMAVNENPQ